MSIGAVAMDGVAEKNANLNKMDVSGFLPVIRYW